jgi:hypothetical protein
LMTINWPLFKNPETKTQTENNLNCHIKI